MPEHLAHPFPDEIGDELGEAQYLQDEASGRGQASPLTRDPGLMGRQDFSRIHTADNSRNHFGNVYNNIYQNNAAHPEFAEATLELMDALAFKGMTDRLMAIGPACAETCTWVLHRPEYTSWRDPDLRRTHNGVLWIKGKAGTGKSTLMRYIHDHAQKHYQDEVDIAFFLNGRSLDQLVKSVEGMYRSILYQVYDRIPRLKMAAAKRVEVTNKQVWSIEILEDMIRRSVFHLASDEKVTVYIDALDECELEQAWSAVEFFERLSRLATTEKKQFFICFSSRYYPHITVQSYKEVRLDTLLEHSSDIRTFLTSEFTIRSPFRSELQAEIEQRCSGIFLWVILVVKLLKQIYNKGATRSQLRETLKSLPPELNELFAKITESAGSEFAIAMRWVLCARVSLPPEELYHAIQVGSGRMSSVRCDASDINIDSIRNYILHVSRGLIECTWENGLVERVQFVHESVREYLLSWSLGTSKGASSHELEITSHAKMLEDCQKYLELCARCRVKPLPPRDVDVGLDDAWRIFPTHPLLNYVIYFIFTHLELACTARPIKYGFLEAFPLSDFVAFYNMCMARDYSRLHRPRNPCVILADHTATLLMLLISFRCYSLAELMLQSQQGPIKRGQTLIRSSAAAGPDLTTCCGGLEPSPLHAAVASRRGDLVELLLEKGADVNIRGSMSPDGVLQLYEGPLMMAVKHSNTAMVKLLLDHGACVNTLSPLTGCSALHEACLRYNLEMIKLLLSNDAAVNIRAGRYSGVNDSNQSRTVLELACGAWPKFAVGILRALLDAGADVNATTIEDSTPLHDVVRLNKFEEAIVLLDYGANTECRSTTFRNAIATANPSMVEALGSEIVMRALQGRNKYLRPAPRLRINRTLAPARIAVPVQPRSRRREIPLQYRHPPQIKALLPSRRGIVYALTESNLQLLTETEAYHTWDTYASSNHTLVSEMSSRDRPDGSDSS